MTHLLVWLLVWPLVYNTTLYIRRRAMESPLNPSLPSAGMQLAYDVAGLVIWLAGALYLN